MTRFNRNVKILVSVAALAVLAACTAGNLDDPDSAPVVMQVEMVTGEPVNTSGGGGNPCVFQVEEWQATLGNVPKNATAITSPYNDINMQTVTISYEWDDLAIVTAPRSFNISGTARPEETVQVDFPPIALGDLDAGTMPGHTANLTLVFTGQTGVNDSVQAIAQGLAMRVNSCPP